MANIKVYQVKVYDVVADKYILSPRMATRRGADVMKSVVLPETETEIDESLLEQGEQWTPLDFKPRNAPADVGCAVLSALLPTPESATPDPCTYNERTQATCDTVEIPQRGSISQTVIVSRTGIIIASVSFAVLAFIEYLIIR